MTLKELRKELLLRLDERLRPLGFRKRDQSFRREVNGCRQILHVSFINHRHDFDVVIDVAVRHHAVEEERNRERPWLNEAVKKETATVGAEIGNIIGTGQHRWTVSDESHVISVVEGIMDYFNLFGLPFLKRFSSLGETARVLAGDSREARLICPVPTEKPKIRSVAEAILEKRVN